MRDVLFMGSVLASATHEMQNIIAIIKESGALAEDIIAMNGLPRMKHGEKIPQALAAIREQVDRGRRIMRMLNAFAHAASDFPEVCDLARYTAQVGVLAARAVLIKGCSLTSAPHSGTLPVKANALLLMQLLYLAVLDVLAAAGKGDNIVLSVRAAQDSSPDSGTPDARACVALRASTALPLCSQGLTSLAKELGADCLAEPGAIILVFPLPEVAEGVRP